MKSIFTFMYFLSMCVFSSMAFAQDGYKISIYKKDLVQKGNTIFADLLDKPKIVEINHNGEITWEYLVPSNIRDAFSIIPDSILNPTSEYFYDLPFGASNGIALNGVHYINKTSLHLGEYENLKKDAIDFYPFMRDLYEQNRINEIKE